MSVNRYNQRNALANPFLHLAAAAGGTAARVAMNRAVNWLSRPSQPPPAQQQPMVIYQQTPTRGARRGRGRGRKPQGMSRSRASLSATPQSSGTVVQIDSEVLLSLEDTNKAVNTYEFDPAPANLTRLQQFSGMYHRYKISHMKISFIPGVGTATAFNVTFGTCVGKPISLVKESADILKLRPSCFRPGWKAGSITLGANIDKSRFMECGTDTAFTLYVAATGACGILQVSYRVEFSYPQPFKSAAITNTPSAPNTSNPAEATNTTAVPTNAMSTNTTLPTTSEAVPVLCDLVEQILHLQRELRADIEVVRQRRSSTSGSVLVSEYDVCP